MATKPIMDVAKHVLVPKHEKCSDAEKKKVLQQYAVQLNNMPRILSTDAAIQALGVQAGDVIKISRESPTAGNTTFYRVVVEE